MGERRTPARPQRNGKPRPPWDKRRASPARVLAHDALVEASRRELFAERLLRDAFRRMEPTRQDRALATFLVQETLRRRGDLDYRLSKLAGRPIASLPIPVREALRLGLVQLLYFDRVPAHAAVDESVKLVRLTEDEEHVALVNAVLRRASEGDVPDLPEGDDDESLAARHSLPTWLIRRWRRHGAQLTGMLEGSNRRPGLVLRVNTSRTPVHRVYAELERLGIEAVPGHLVGECIRVQGRLDLAEFAPFQSGLVSVQDESEALVADLVDPLPQHRILDVCAAPGGKTQHLLERTGGLVSLVAMDVSRRRLRLLAENLRRSGQPALTVCGNGRYVPFRGEFDRVLVDAPCTGTGVLARRADVRWRLSSDSALIAAEEQRAILDAAAPRCALGGLLVYAVCSIEPEETDLMIDAFLERQPGFREETAETLPIMAKNERGRLRVLPGTLDCDGVFGVRLRRIA